MPEIIAPVISALLGLLSACFAGHWGWRMADRLPGEPAWPQCAYCQRAARWWELLPVLGWLIRRKPLALVCPCGQRGMQWMQPAMEIMGMLLGLYAGLMFGWSWAMVWLSLCFGILPAIALIDLYFGIIPDMLNIALAVLGLAWLLAGGGELTTGLAIAGIMLMFALALALGYSKLRGKDMLGFGDVKFFGAAGLWLQPELLPWFLIIAGALGAVGGLLWQRAGGGEQSPFAPAMVIAFAGCLMHQVAMAAFA
ncbi:MAG: hypothetical protein GC131_00690 [Alphaproteobacteria bacterium]|nr:hypothetical protein [Alphaproteobacteria bacterium]